LQLKGPPAPQSTVELELGSPIACQAGRWKDWFLAAVFANADAAETWFEENDPEAVAFEHEVLE
jgi:hypothetical protein